MHNDKTILKHCKKYGKAKQKTPINLHFSNFKHSDWLLKKLLNTGLKRNFVNYLSWKVLYSIIRIQKRTETVSHLFPLLHEQYDHWPIF